MDGYLASIIIMPHFSLVWSHSPSHFGGEKPKRKDNLWYFVGLLVLISSISGLIAVNLDMMVEPITASSPVPDWVWLLGGPYFGVPISNFIGWFSVTLVAIFIFRFYEAFSPSSTDSKPEIDKYSYLYIIILYIIYLLFNAVKAYNLEKIEYILIGVTTMAPFILIGLLALMLNKKRR